VVVTTGGHFTERFRASGQWNSLPSWSVWCSDIWVSFMAHRLTCIGQTGRPYPVKCKEQQANKYTVPNLRQ
jgi:hypothetical protein